MKTLLVTGYGVKIGFRDGVFVVNDSSGKKTISPLEVEQIVIASSGVSITSKTIRKIIEYGIDLVFLDSRGYPIGRVYPPYINRTVETRRRQYEAYGTDKGATIIVAIVKAKILNQAGLVKRYYYITRRKELRESYHMIRDVVDNIGIKGMVFDEVRDYLRQKEAYVARIYWDTVSTLLPEDIGFDGRDQDSSDPFNMSLNYGYGLLYKECWRALVLAGLDPYAGFMHADYSGKPVLVYDYIEQYRFVVDYILVKLFRRGWRPEIDNGLLTYDSRIKIIREIEEFLDNTRVSLNESTPYTLRQVIKKKAFELASYLRGKKMFYEGYVWEW